MTSKNIQHTDPATLTRKDMQSDQEVRWCPGCGDYSILAQVQRTLPTLGIPRENFVVIGGIGCSSRFPYYMDTYGMHTIHGRAPAFASGIKSVNPDLSVWVITGDGDGLSIGGNHLLHILRRNVNVKILLFNNRVYGLTKGQYSPTSLEGMRSASSPMGSIDHPVDPVRFALGAAATFVARTMDVDVKHFQETLGRAAAHSGTSFVEIYQNCPIFNDGVFAQLTDKSKKADTVLHMEHGKPLLFGKERDKGIALDKRYQPIIVEADSPDVIVHDETNPGLAMLLSQLHWPAFPALVGVFRKTERPTYETMLVEQVEEAQAKKRGTLQDLLEAGETWRVG